MTLLERLRKIVSFGRSAPADPIRWPTGFPFLSPFLTYAGINLTPYDALQVSAVWGCVDAITRAIAPSHWHVYERTDTSRGQTLVGRYDDPLEWVLNRRPNPWMTAIALREALMYSALVWGNGYSEIVKDNAGKVTEMWPLMPERVIPRVEEDGTDSKGNTKWKMIYRYTQPTGGYVDLEPERVFHLRGMSVGGLMGDNLIARGAKSIAMAVAAEQFAASYFANGTVVGGILEFPGKLTKETIERLRNEWTEWRASPAKAHRPLFLEAGMKFSSIEVDPAKTQLTEVRQYSVEDICRWFGVPPSKIGHVHSSGHTYNNTEYAGIDWVNTGLRPWAERLQQEANFKLFPQRAPWRETIIDFDWLKEGTAKEKAEAAAVRVNAGLITRNEWRQHDGWNDLPGGDVLTVPSTQVSLANAINPPKPEPPKQLPAPGEKPTEPAKPGETKPKPGDVAKAAIALDRFTRRLSARKLDLEKNSPEKAAECLAEERKRLEPAFFEECWTTYPGAPLEALRRITDAVMEGEPVHLAAERLASSVPLLYRVA